MHSLRKAQIVNLKADEVPTKISNEYANFVDVLLLKLAVKLHEYTRINDYTIKLVDDRQLLYGPIYSIGPVVLESLKIHI